ncbi:metabolite traffic protein EboE [Agromyces sp. Leaf222]|uniref:metabolite traffic protein EboE n=1 Tax=Agromyces sp. Leaf222 TaxID=1735688 RepID=UPI00070229CA|nr:metabolite traffic protein EboE [Agromyces sp. Leaf222]KQM80924.1 xylose isomerase [Agromyces sp. Leaf222]
MELSYCTNVHPAEDLDGVLDQLTRYAGPARRAAGLDRLGVGLWLPAPLAHRLAEDPGARERLRAGLEAEGLEVRTINAFPFTAFHAEVVKLDVYRPDWTDPRRADYTLDCARVLADLLHDGAVGSISTLPLGWRFPWTPAEDDAATAALDRVSTGLRELRDRTGRTIRLAIEPEPGCVLDTVDDIVEWLSPRLGPGRLDPEFIGICLDTCHLAASFADPAETVRRVGRAGIRIPKVQASAALHIADPSEPAAREALAAFAEPRYLHQTRALAPDGVVLRADDLPDALDEVAGLRTDGPWRVHFHVPLHLEPEAPLSSTTDVLRRAVAAVRELPDGDSAHLDVETYTWTVLPGGAGDLVEGIAAELRWAAGELLGDPAGAAPGAARPAAASGAVGVAS